MYHANTHINIKEKVLKSLTKNDGDTRVVICTSTLGCGVDCSDIKFVLHFGPPHNLIDYVQHIGRAGRASEADCHAVLYIYPQFVKISDDVKEYFNSNSCLRKRLFNPFSESIEIESLSPKQQCCNICSQSCSCGDEKCKFTY